MKEQSTGLKTVFERRGFKVKLFTGLFFALLATLAVSLIAYKSVSKLVTALHEESKPNEKLVLLNEIMSDLSDAESSVRAYTITNDANYLFPYQQAVSSIEERLRKVGALNNDEGQQARLDSIDNLIQEKYLILNELLSLRQDDEAKDVLTQIIGKIADKEEEAGNENEKKKLSRLKELFRSKKDKEPTAAEELADLQNVVAKIKEEEAEKAELTKQKELELTKADAEIMNDIRFKVDEIESFELALAQLRAKKAEQLANYATAIITVISVSAFLLVFSLAYLVLSFVNRTTHYNKEITEAKERTEKLAKAKEEFLANMSHEIRTPMNAILGFSEQLEKTQLDAKQKLYTGTMKDSIEHLLVVVNDILDHSKLESGKFTFEKTGFKPVDVVSHVLASFRKTAQEKNLLLDVQTDENVPHILIGDPHRLKQILYNLIGNALKFTEEGKVRVRMKAFTKENNSVELNVGVLDTGIGIPQNKIQNIFEDFYQSEASTTRKYGGTGLGLAITKKLVELQNGKLEVKSEEGKGSEFSFTIPYLIGKEIDLEEQLTIPSEPSMVLGGFSVLAADDEEYNRMLLEAILSRWSMKLVVCDNGKKAIEELQNNHYDLLLMDVRMPEINGLEATTKIRQEFSGEKSKIPIIALTAAGSEEDIRKCRIAGMNDFLSKPFREAELFEKICSVLKIDIDYAAVRKLSGQTDNVENQTEPGKVYDITELKRLSNGDDNFVQEMITVFIQNTQDGMQKIELAIQKKDWEKAGLLAHRLAAPSRHLRMKSILKKLKEIENTAAHGNASDTIPATFKALEAEVRIALEQLAQEKIL